MLKDVKVVFEDKNLIFCIKGVGLSSEDTGDEKCVPAKLREMCGVKEVYTLHRLDTGVSGIMVYAKTKDAAAKMSTLISDGKMKKEYEAVVYGTFDEKQGEMCDFLFKDSRKNKSFVVKSQRKGTKFAKLFYNVKEEFLVDEKEVSLVEITLETGRSHQIRVQFSSRKHALLGDGKYGAKDNIKNICLMSKRISFVSPFTNKEVCFECEGGLREILEFYLNFATSCKAKLLLRNS